MLLFGIARSVNVSSVVLVSCIIVTRVSNSIDIKLMNSNNNNNNNNSLFDPIMKNTIRNTILENKLRYGHPKKPSGLV